MIKRHLDQKINWVNVEYKIYDEISTMEWRLFGILLRRRTVVVEHTIGEEDKKPMGFGKGSS